MRSSENNDIYEKKEILCPYITKKGRRIYPKNAKFFHFFIKVKK